MYRMPLRNVLVNASNVVCWVIFFLGVAVAMLGRKLYAIGGLDGHSRLRRFVTPQLKFSGE